MDAPAAAAYLRSLQSPTTAPASGGGGLDGPESAPIAVRTFALPIPARMKSATRLLMYLAAAYVAVGVVLAIKKRAR